MPSMRPAIRLSALLLFSASPLVAIPIVRSDINSGPANHYGCDAWVPGAEGTWYTFTRLAGASPSGTDAIRVQWIQTNDLGNEPFGCYFDNRSLGPAPAQGATRYARWRIRYVGPVNWRSDTNALNEYVPNNRTAPDKLFILGNNCGTPTRMIFHQYAAAPSRSIPLVKFTQGTGRGDNPVPIDQWLNIQVRVVSSNSTTSTDGHTAIWVNNNTESSPTFVLTGLLITTTGWGSGAGCDGGNMVWGDGSANPLSDDDPTTRAVIDMADFEYDDEFDPAWNIPAGPFSACDLNSSSSTNVTDVQLCANQAIGAASCANGDIDQSGNCNVVDVQRVVNAALGGACVSP